METEGKLIKANDEYYYLVSNSTDLSEQKLLRLSANGKVIADVIGDNVQKLSLQNCYEIEINIDIHNMAIKLIHTDPEYIEHGFTKFMDGKYNGFIEGVETIIEISKDKKFTEDDIRKAYKKGEEDSYTQGGLTKQKEDNYIQSLQQTEWDVIIEMEPAIYTAILPKDREERPAYKPKLDENGCLILKRK